MGTPFSNQTPHNMISADSSHQLWFYPNRRNMYFPSRVVDYNYDYGALFRQQSTPNTLFVDYNQDDIEDDVALHLRSNIYFDKMGKLKSNERLKSLKSYKSITEKKESFDICMDQDDDIQHNDKIKFSLFSDQNNDSQHGQSLVGAQSDMNGIKLPHDIANYQYTEKNNKYTPNYYSIGKEHAWQHTP